MGRLLDFLGVANMATSASNQVGVGFGDLAGQNEKYLLLSKVSSFTFLLMLSAARLKAALNLVPQAT